MFFRIVDGVFTGTNVPQPPGSDNFQMRRQGFHRQFKTNLVIAFAGSAVSDGVCAFFFSDGHHGFGDQRPSEGGTQQVFSFINSAGFQRRPYILFQKGFHQIFDINLAGARSNGFLPNDVQFVALADIGAHGDNLAAIIVFFQPGNDYRSIQASRVGQYHFFDFTHCNFLLAYLPITRAMMAFCTCSRFSASSKTTDCGPSRTSSVISSPRCAGRQCRTMAFLSAAASTCWLI